MGSSFLGSLLSLNPHHPILGTAFPPESSFLNLGVIPASVSFVFAGLRICSTLSPGAVTTPRAGALLLSCVPGV